MTNKEFREWLKGFFELSDEDVCLTMEQARIISNHLNLAEAVEGKLDETNQKIRFEFETYRNNPAGNNEALQSLTLSIQQLLL